MSLMGKLALLGLAVCLFPVSVVAQLSESEAHFVTLSVAQPQYGVTMEPPSAEDLLRDHALWTANRIRAELARDGSLSPELLSEAKHLQRQRYSFLAPRDRALVDAALSLRLGGFSVSGPGAVIVLPPMAAVPAAVLAQEDFPTFLLGVRSDAAKDGVPPAVLDEALTGLTVDPQVLAAENSRPEKVITYEEYLSRVVSDQRVADGRRQLGRQKEILDRVVAAYGVPAPNIAALWGMESDYGANQGHMQVVRSLATLAYQGRRPAFFREELIAALHLLAEEHMSAKDLKGSWAGALGQPQFMPSTFRRLAVDFDGDGRRDIWNSAADVTASIANFLVHAGWDKASGWGQEVMLPADFDQSLASLSVVKSAADWQAAGVRPMAGAVLPAGALGASVLRPSGPGGRAFLVLPNFRVMMRYNNSIYYATAGGLLADRIAAP